MKPCHLELYKKETDYTHYVLENFNCAVGLTFAKSYIYFICRHNANCDKTTIKFIFVSGFCLQINLELDLQIVI